MLHLCAPVPLLWGGARYHVLPHAREHAGDGGTVRPAGDARLGAQGTMHRAAWRAYHVYRSTESSDVRPVRCAFAANGYHGRCALPRRVDEAGEREDVHGLDERVWPHGNRPGNDAE